VTWIIIVLINLVVMKHYDKFHKKIHKSLVWLGIIEIIEKYSCIIFGERIKSK